MTDAALRGGRKGVGPIKTPELMDEICDRIADGETLRSICRDERMPSARAVYDWVDADPDFASRLASGEVDAPDVFCGGTPCQSFSVAGNRRSLNDNRDVRLPVARGGFIGLIIEMKAGKNGLTDAQKLYRKGMEFEGHRTAVCYSWVEAKSEIEGYLAMARTLRG